MTGTSPQPTLWSERLELRPFTLADAPAVQALANAPQIASTTLNIPHPYAEGIAEDWISTHGPSYEAGTGANFALIEKSSGELIGTVGLVIRPAHVRAELGYWIGVPYWNKGYATEAGRAVIRYGFNELGLNRIHASFFVRNPASGRVMRKLGMEYEGLFPQHIRKWGRFEDLEQYGILREDWLRQNADAYSS